ncbi:unnamed protein product [Allacma fusca]|uniref:Uncharacterized protein n=1 Tax=Allacma fusca TaxID=39272 RepID=A0A8J2PBY8_9HEXA|nr:unnamed protein product [Allacma fusca]
MLPSVILKPSFENPPSYREAVNSYVSHLRIQSGGQDQSPNMALPGPHHTIVVIPQLQNGQLSSKIDVNVTIIPYPPRMDTLMACDRPLPIDEEDLGRSTPDIEINHCRAIQKRVLQFGLFIAVFLMLTLLTLCLVKMAIYFTKQDRPVQYS